MNKTLNLVKTYGIITLGLIIYVVGWTVFLIPNKIVGGGASGIGTIVFYATGGSIVDGAQVGGFPIGYSFFIFNAIFMSISLKILGKEFAIKTIYAIVVASFLFQWIPEIIIMIGGEHFGTTFCEQNGPFICAIMGGVASGTGIALAVGQGGSTGGTDIIAVLISKYRNISPGRVILYLDLIIIGSSYFISHDFMRVLYGYILTALAGSTLDYLLSGNKQSMQFFIFSKSYAELADTISTETGRGVSVMNVTGWFTKDEQKVLMVIVKKHESQLVYRLIKEVDKDAFISVALVSGVFGQGFDEIKAKALSKPKSQQIR